MSGVGKLRRVTDLFDRGAVVVLGEAGDGPVLVWVSKLNAFERGEAQRDGAAGRARRMLVLGEDHEQTRLVRVSAAARTNEELAGQLAEAGFDELYVAAMDDVRADPAWAQRLVVLDRSESLLDDAGADDADEARAEVAKLNREFFDRVDELAGKAREESLRELAGLDHAELVDRFVGVWRDRMGGDDFGREFSTTELFYSLRDCVATAVEHGWDHAGCTHPRLLGSRAQVRDLPEDLVVVVREAMSGMLMSPRDAGNSAAPATSSGSSGQLNVEAASTPSTPVGT